jgi:hypothetical protein
MWSMYSWLIEAKIGPDVAIGKCTRLIDAGEPVAFTAMARRGATILLYRTLLTESSRAWIVAPVTA